MKLTYEQKLKAYQDWKSNLKSPGTIAKELHAGETVVRYFLRLADKHGTETLKHTNNKYYSPEEKLRIINRILISNGSIKSVSADEGLRDDSLLRAWIKSYKENKYNVIEKK
ncbi:MAG: transposase, partial [Solobacterium sp.]|nr:transposase [Solobacterium sp.]